VLIMSELEQSFLRSVEDLPITPYEDSDGLLRVNEIVIGATTSWISSAPLHSAATAAFASLLAHYKATHRVLHMADDDVIQAASDLLLGCGLTDQPVISKKLAICLGLEKHPRILCAARLGDDDWQTSEVSRPGGHRHAARGAPNKQNVVR